MNSSPCKPTSKDQGAAYRTSRANNNFTAYAGIVNVLHRKIAKTVMRSMGRKTKMKTSSHQYEFDWDKLCIWIVSIIVVTPEEKEQEETVPETKRARQSGKRVFSCVKSVPIASIHDMEQSVFKNTYVNNTSRTKTRKEAMTATRN